MDAFFLPCGEHHGARTHRQRDTGCNYTDHSSDLWVGLPFVLHFSSLSEKLGSSTGDVVVSKAVLFVPMFQLLSMTSLLHSPFREDFNLLSCFLI